MAARDSVEPAAAARSTRRGAVLVANVADALGGLIEQLCRERSFADTAAVRFVDADRPRQSPRTDAGPLQQAGDRTVAAGYVRIGAVVEVEQRRMGAFEDDLATARHGFVDQRLRLGNKRLQPFSMR